ncbi:uncharacterized protein LOC144103500 [Amblyomma americanum]
MGAATVCRQPHLIRVREDLINEEGGPSSLGKEESGSVPAQAATKKASPRQPLLVRKGEAPPALASCVRGGPASLNPLRDANFCHVRLLPRLPPAVLQQVVEAALPRLAGRHLHHLPRTCLHPLVAVPGQHPAVYVTESRTTGLTPSAPASSVAICPRVGPSMAPVSLFGLRRPLGASNCVSVFNMEARPGIRTDLIFWKQPTP